MAAHGLEEIFKAIVGSEAVTFARYLCEKLGKPCQAPEVGTEYPVTFN